MNSQPRVISLIAVLLVAACAGHSNAVSRSAPGPAPAPADTSWLIREPAICGELSGRVLDAATGLPLRDAYVSIEGARTGTSTDTLGRFRIVLSKQGIPGLGETRSIPVRIRRIGNFDLRFELPRAPGYVVEVVLGRWGVALDSPEWHLPAITSLTIKDQGSCVRAT